MCRDRRSGRVALEDVVRRKGRCLREMSPIEQLPLTAGRYSVGTSRCPTDEPGAEKWYSIGRPHTRIDDFKTSGSESIGASPFWM